MPAEFASGTAGSPIAAECPPTLGRAPASGRPLRADVVARYDLGVDAYETLWSPVILPVAAALVPWLKLSEGSVVVDVGAGTGALAGAIREAASTARILALDASAAMLQLAHERPGVAAVRADAAALPVAGGTVDAVMLAYVLFHLPDPLAALREAARVLRPGGRVGIVTWASDQPEQAELVWSDVLSEAGVPPLPPGRVDHELDSAEALDAMVRAAHLVPHRIWVQGLRHQWDRMSFWDLVTGTGVNRIRLGRLDPASRAAVLARFRERLSRLAPEDYVWEGEVVCTVAAKPPVSTDAHHC